MSKTKHSVTTKFGTFTRTTARTYSHFVITTGWTVAKTLSSNNERIASLRREIAEYNEKINTGTGEFSASEYAEFIVSCERDIEKLTARNASVTESTEYSAVAWCSRIDLARAQARKHVEQGYGNVRIIEVATGNEVA